MTEPTRVRFVSAGKTFADGRSLFGHLVDAAGLSDEFEIDSAGTGAWHTGQPRDRGATAALLGGGYWEQARQAARPTLRTSP